MKNFLLFIIIIFVQNLTKPEPVLIKFDYSNLDINNSNLETIIKNEFGKVESYFRNLLESPPNSDVSKKLNKLTKSIITCEDKTEYKFKKKI